MGMPGSSEWLIIFGVALLIFGPSKLPQLGGAIGESIRNFRKGVKNLENDDRSAEPSRRDDEAQSKTSSQPQG